MGPPTHRELAWTPSAPLILDRQALRASAHKLCRLKHTMMVSEWPRQLSIVLLARWPFPFPPTRHTLSTEHDRDSQSSLPVSKQMGPDRVKIISQLLTRLAAGNTGAMHIFFPSAAQPQVILCSNVCRRSKVNMPSTFWMISFDTLNRLADAAT